MATPGLLLICESKKLFLFIHFDLRNSVLLIRATCINLFIYAYIFSVVLSFLKLKQIVSFCFIVYNKLDFQYPGVWVFDSVEAINLRRTLGKYFLKLNYWTILRFTQISLNMTYIYWTEVGTINQLYTIAVEIETYRFVQYDLALKPKSLLLVSDFWNVGNLGTLFFQKKMGLAPLITDLPPTSSIQLFKNKYKRDMWHVTPEMWHVTCDIWHVMCDTWHMVVNNV